MGQEITQKDFRRPLEQIRTNRETIKSQRRQHNAVGRAVTVYEAGPEQMFVELIKWISKCSVL